MVRREKPVLGIAMLTTIVLAAPESFMPAPPAAAMQKLVRTLAALVPLAVDGFLGEVILAGPARDAMARLADEAGCGLVSGSGAAQTLAAALAKSSRRWTLVLAAGHAPEAGFAEEAADFIASGESRAAVLREAPARFWARLFPDLAPAAGLLAASRLLPAKPLGDLPGLARQLRPAGVTLRTRARRVL